MKLTRLGLLLFLAYGAQVGYTQEVTEELDNASVNKIEPEVLTRTDALPAENLEEGSDLYLEGYIQALLDIHYFEYRVDVTVRNHKVYLANLPRNELISNSILAFVKDLPGVAEVHIQDVTQRGEEQAEHSAPPRVNGIWFPQMTVLFQPLVADPREPVYSGGLRFGDPVMGDVAGVITLGDDFPIYRWRDVFHHGDMQIGIQAGTWSVFNFTHVPKTTGECELVNTDFLGGIALTYAHQRWAHRIRLYHISSHLGDEYLVDHPEMLALRVNPSFEALEWVVSCQLSGFIRLYGGAGLVFHSDPSFPLRPLYAKYGAELRLWGKKLYYHRLYGTPFFAIHVENWQGHKWDPDLYLKLGYEVSKLQGVGRKMRIYFDYHKGFSEGQLSNLRTHHAGAGMSWGF